ncbi:thiamine-phosphate kinase [Henriciella mobilis]|uniref:Thiamine-monophosphate kinase n=1 Tax=Henriciella mobilis TaxID=2305467 RepID=A0A399RE49_9PROT|nr:thiamine-phosphate kinase [Henriciella mobilis]
MGPVSEFDWISKYLKPIATSEGAMSLENDVGILASLPPDRPLIATMDTLVEGVHFFRGDPPETLGKKILRVNVSDILCNGAVPKDALLSVALPDWFDEPRFERFCGGLGHDLAQWNVKLVGGDLVSTPGPLVLTMTVTGSCLSPNPVARSGAMVGDAVCVSGTIGAGYQGLDDAKAGRDSPFARHFRVPDIPAPEIAEILSAHANAAIDISDGLIAEAIHVGRASRKAICLDMETVPWARNCASVADMIELGTGGDDYQVLMTLPESKLDIAIKDAASAGIRLTRIGHVAAGDELQLKHRGKIVPVPAKLGFVHGN